MIETESLEASLAAEGNDGELIATEGARLSENGTRKLFLAQLKAADKLKILQHGRCAKERDKRNKI